MQPDEQRIDQLHQRIIHLEIADVLDAGGGHLIECARSPECEQTSAVTVGRECHPMLLLEQDLAVLRERRHHSLLEEMNARRFETEVRILLEEDPRLLVVLRAGHDVPAQIGTVSLVGTLNKLSKELK